MSPALRLLLLLLLASVPFAVRASYKQRPSPRRKPGETEAEGHIVLLGTFRIYSWLVWLNLTGLVLSFVTPPLLALLLVRVLALATTLLAVRALYWRLGYERGRWIMVLGHVTGAFMLTEYFYGLRHDVSAYLTQYETSQSVKA